MNYYIKLEIPDGPEPDFSDDDGFVVTKYLGLPIAQMRLRGGEPVLTYPVLTYAIDGLIATSDERWICLGPFESAVEANGALVGGIGTVLDEDGFRRLKKRARGFYTDG